MQRARSLGWYSGKRALINFSFKGGFEEWGAYECWGHRVFLETEEIIGENGKIIWPYISVDGNDIEEVAEKALQILSKV